MKIRIAQKDDLPAITEIYNQAIRAGNATGDQQEMTADDKIHWFKEHSADKYPIYVIEEANNIIGWGSLSSYRKGREAFVDAAEITYYIDYNFHDLGYGAYLLNYMLKECPRFGIRNVLALLLEINLPSVNLLKKFDFEQWGYLPDVASLKKGRCAHLIYGKNIK